MTANQSFHANGKILLTGEYLVLLGAKSMAIPLIHGQQLTVVNSIPSDILNWKSTDPGGVWFTCRFSLPDLGIIESSDENTAIRLKTCLQAARKINGAFLSENSGFTIKTDLGFNRHWGFGSSSTLIALIAGWAEIDPLLLHRLISNGSGYDVACSLSDSPVFYSLKKGIPEIIRTVFDPPFGDKLFLVYRGNKQSSELEVDSFIKQSQKKFSKEIEQISRISEQISVETQFEAFTLLLSEHEEIIGKVLGRKPVKYYLFHDFKGAVKSLGAWGGDFILVASEEGKEYVAEYFQKKNHDTILPFRSVALAGKNIINSF